MSKKQPEYVKQLLAQNKKATHDYFIEEKFETGIVLKGTEVKSLRDGRASINEAHANHMEGEIFLLGSNIPEYKKAHQFNHHPRRPRKLLLKKREIKKMIGLLQKKGYTLIPLSLYFNNKNLVKVSLGLAKGKKKYDKRESIKQRDWDRKKARILKNTE